MLCTRCLRATLARRPALLSRSLSVSPALPSSQPPLSTPVTAAGKDPKPAPKARSVCPEGTVLSGLNYLKGGQDPVAMKDEDYPDWLWSCLDVTKKSATVADAAEGDEFSKSKKQRRLAAKSQKNIEVKESQVPLQHQSINLPGQENGSLEENLKAAEARKELKKAMRKERKAKIKESNYLKSM